MTLRTSLGLRALADMWKFIFESNVGLHGAPVWEAELADVGAAHIEAVKCFGEILRDAGGSFWALESAWLTARRENGSLLFKLEMHAAAG